MASKSGEKKGSDRLPFEPGSNRKKAGKDAAEPAKSKAKASKPKASKPKSEIQKKGEEARRQLANAGSKKNSKARRSRQDNAIPEEISRRMIKRMAVLCGVPTVLGISTFIVSYFIVINEVFELPPIAVLLVSLGFFGLGVLGLSYGALSTSWEEGEADGSVLGVDEFKINFSRMRQAWKESREAKSQG